MAKCVLLFLFLILGACNNDDDKIAPKNLRWSQVGETSFAEWNGQTLRIDALKESQVFDAEHRFTRLSDDLWIFEAGKVAVWRIDGDIPDEFMYLQDNSIAILGRNAAIPKALALRFSMIIVLWDFDAQNLFLIMEHYKEKVVMADNNREIIFTTDGVSWYFR
jgi:hypothetical protein